MILNIEAGGKSLLEHTEIGDSIETTDDADFADFNNKNNTWCLGDFVVEIKTD
jgi:hypothetical protein